MVFLGDDVTISPTLIGGPFLFLLYINYLPNCLQYSQPRMYADDTSNSFGGSDVDEMNNCINLDLKRIRVWLAAKKITYFSSRYSFPYKTLLVQFIGPTINYGPSSSRLLQLGVGILL